jgi:hypothetical protein
VWDSTAAAKGADLDFVVLEPDGSLYMPFLGTVTPNGHLTPDSYDVSTWFEGYLTKQFVLRGRYRFYAMLFDDPMDEQPLFDFAYRFGQTTTFRWLFSPDLPSLSFEKSWLDDAGATLAKVEAGAYTDFAYAAFVDLGASGSGLIARAGGPLTLARPGSDAPAGEEPIMTRAQLEVLRQNMPAVRTRRALQSAVPHASLSAGSLLRLPSSRVPLK